ncbi:Transposable element P transposase [Frankliniella fusca]|uniref:Transposable element P transposase n=1 Tax=Frankliniella fusca TaxID=407009 RepID=A0AAE1I3J2_9NEOP|nr:Transposable element P transposase [Frankliniella fusca]
MALWESLIKRGDRKMTLDSRVCNEHFTINDFDLNYEVKLPNGKVEVIPRGKAKLKPEANPSIFPMYPAYLQPKVSSRKEPCKRRSPKKKVTDAPQPDIIVTDTEPLADTEPSADTETLADTSEDCTHNSSSASKKVDWSCEAVSSLTLPINWVVGNTPHQANRKFLAHIEPSTMTVNKTILFIGKEPAIVTVRGITQKVNTHIKTVVDAQNLLMQIDRQKLCSGTGFDTKKFSVACEGAVGVHAMRCSKCVTERERLKKNNARKQAIIEKENERKRKMKNRLRSLRKSKVNLLNKVNPIFKVVSPFCPTSRIYFLWSINLKVLIMFQIKKYKVQIESAIRECEQKKETVLQEAIEKLPPAQQEAVKACFDASKKKSPSGRRYTTEWVYECMLMRIKDKKLYNHLRNHQILCLPCTSTINGYLKHYGGAYGFQPQILEMLKKKTEGMSSKSCRGVILIDEMKLTQGVYFDASTLQVLGFKDMGEECRELLGEDFNETVQNAYENLPFDPKAAQKKQRREKSNEKKNRREKNLGDHALVISFQPFRGKWVQAIACFLTRGNASDEELTKLVLEAVILLERSGLIVDAVVTDGATWNRSMWTKFGVTADKPSAEHPCDTDRCLWFISDFPHLLKCMRNCLCTKKIIKTPKGDVKLDHWEGILDAESLRQVGLRECHKLTRDHINPGPWQKMNVGMAWQFWSASVAAAMETLRFQGVDKLEDCDPSVDLVRRINSLADAMNSNRPQNAMRLNSPQFEDIKTFLEYFQNLKVWANDRLNQKLILAEKSRIKILQQQGKKPRAKPIPQQEDYIFSESTDIGLLVSLKAAMELVEFLVKKCDFQYVMMARLNQDALERFFGLVRQSCGGNTHPEPRVFAQLFRLLSIYSLVKPMRGSNITGGEMVTTLLTLEDLKNKTRQERQKALMEKLDQIVLNGQNLDDIPELIDTVDHDHSYILGESIDEFALSYVSGFVARHSRKYVKDCEECAKSLKKSEKEKTDVDMLITCKTRGWLTYATDDLISLLRTMEEKIIQTSLLSEMEENFLFIVLEKMENVDVKKIGCEAHAQELTKSIMKFYLIFRMHFLTKRWNQKT